MSPFSKRIEVKDLSSLSDEDKKRWKVENPLTDNRKDKYKYSYNTTGPGGDYADPKMDPYTIGAYFLLFNTAYNRIPTEKPEKPWVIYKGEGDKSQVTYKGDVRWINNKGNWEGTNTLQAHGYGIEYANDGTYTGTFNNGERSGIGQLTTKDSTIIGFLEKGKFLSNIKTNIKDETSQFILNSETFILAPYENLFKVFGVNLKENIKTFIEKAENQAKIGQNNFDQTIQDAEHKFNQLFCKPQIHSTSVVVYNNTNNKASGNICNEYEDTGIYGYTEKDNSTYFGNTNEKGIPHGLGKLTKVRLGVITTVSTGNFVDGKLNGFGEIKGFATDKETDSHYLGNFKDDLLHGCGFKYERGKWSLGRYHNEWYFSDNFINGSPPEEKFNEKEKNSLQPFWRGNNYYLVKKIKEELSQNPNDKVRNFFKLCEVVVNLAKQKQSEDIKTAEINKEKEKQTKLERETKQQQINDQNAKIKKEEDKTIAADDTYKKIIHPLLDVNKITTHLKVITTIDGEYKGSLSNINEPFGFGTMNFNNNDVYIGGFERGKMHGLGQLTYYADKSKYIGQFQGGFPKGFGVLITADNTKYYSDSFNGRDYGEQLTVPTIKFDERLLLKQQGNSLVSLSGQNGNSLVSLSGQNGNSVVSLSGENGNSVVSLSGQNGNSLVSAELHGQPLVTDNKDLFGKNFYLVVQIRSNIEKDVKIVLQHANKVTEAAVETTKLELEAQETARLELEVQNTNKLNEIINNFTTQIKNLQHLTNDRLVKPDDAIDLPGLKEKTQSIEQTIEFLKENQNNAKKQKLLSNNAQSAENKIIFYQDCDYKGNAWSVEDGTQTFKGDKISSIKVPEGKQVIVFRHGDTQGLTITKDTPCLTEITGNDGKNYNDEIEIVISGKSNGTGTGKSTGKSTGTGFSKVALISAATAAATAGLYYAYKKYNKSAKKSSDKRSEPKRSEPKRSEPKRSEPKRSEPKRSEPKRSETKRSEPKRSHKSSEPRRSAKKRSDKSSDKRSETKSSETKSSETKRSAKRSEKKRKRRSDISNRSAKKSSEKKRSERRRRSA